MTSVLLSVRLQCSCVLLLEKLCCVTNPGEEEGCPLGNLGGDMPLRSVLEPFGYTRASLTDFCHPRIE